MSCAGISTGSVYKDVALLRNGFPAESVNNGSVIVVKTHEYGPDVRKNFDAAILVVRCVWRGGTLFSLFPEAVIFIFIIFLVATNINGFGKCNSPLCPTRRKILGAIYIKV